MTIIDIVIALLVLLMVFIAGRVSRSQKSKDMYNISHKDYVAGVWLTQTYLLGSTLINRPFEILSVSGSIEDMDHPYYNHYLYIIHFKDDPEYLIRTLAISDSIHNNSNLNSNFTKKCYEFDVVADRICTIEEFELYETGESGMDIPIKA